MTWEGEDTDLIAKTLAGETQAFSALMRRHKGPLYRFVRHYVGDADEAYDLVQESFVAAWSSLKTFDPKRPFSTWLRRIALNKCRDWSRRRAVRKFFFRAAPLDDSHERVAMPETSRHRDAELDALDCAIASLPTNLKEPLLLTVFDGLSHQDAGALLGLSAKAVETRIYRAKQALARALHDTSVESEG